MASFKQMTKDGVIKRADAEKIRYEDIHVEPGFNLGDRNEAHDDDDVALLEHIKNGGVIPDLEVRPREAGGVWIVDGHRRHTQIGAADKQGAPLRDKTGELWVSVVQFIGNDVERTVRLMTSNANKKLTALQTAEGYARLSRFGKSPDEIAALFTKTRQHVDQLLILAGANNDVHQMVKDGKVSATVAVEMVRKHGELAGAFIAAAGDENGGRKVTAKAVKPWVPPASHLSPLLGNAESLVRSLPIEFIKAASDGWPNDSMEEITITVPSAVLFALVSNIEGIAGIRAAAEEKQRAKAAKASQQSIKEEV